MRPWFNSWVWKIHWRRDRLPTPILLGFPCGSAGKESACNVGDLGSIAGLGRSPGEGKGYLLQYSGLENSMDSTVHLMTECVPLPDSGKIPNSSRRKPRARVVSSPCALLVAKPSNSIGVRTLPA